ncbi:hypothetical protein OL548_06275 [Lysinibacillus sp. MHQ-1]|nr:hypothetical protein OL548_06275 [Lysinibacillus sp. MHQ-1]
MQKKQGEQIPRASLVAAVLGTALIAFGYYTAASDMFTSEIWRFFTVLGTPLMVIGVTIVGTYLLFHSVSVFVLTALKKSHILVLERFKFNWGFSVIVSYSRKC